MQIDKDEVVPRKIFNGSKLLLPASFFDKDTQSGVAGEVGRVFHKSAHPQP
jgi:hypothetical protein